MRKDSNEQAAIIVAKRKYVRFISHEIRTPLNSVYMACGVLLDELNKLSTLLKRTLANQIASQSMKIRNSIENGLKESLELSREIKENTRNAVEVLNDLLDYDKIEVSNIYIFLASLSVNWITLSLAFTLVLQDSSLKLDVGLVDFESLITSTASSFHGQITAKHIQLTIDFESYNEHKFNSELTLLEGNSHNFTVLGDRVRLTQVIRNLISNAIKFSEEGGKITISGNGFYLPIVSFDLCLYNVCVFVYSWMERHKRVQWSS
jgi:signal transduction histidine kinase